MRNRSCGLFSCGAVALSVWFFHAQIEELFKISGTFLALAVLVVAGSLASDRSGGPGRAEFLLGRLEPNSRRCRTAGVITLVLYLFKGGASGALVGVLSGLRLHRCCIWKTHPCGGRGQVDFGTGWSAGTVDVGADTALYGERDTLVVKATFDAGGQPSRRLGIVTQAMIFLRCRCHCDVPKGCEARRNPSRRCY